MRIIETINKFIKGLDRFIRIVMAPFIIIFVLIVLVQTMVVFERRGIEYNINNECVDLMGMVEYSKRPDIDPLKYDVSDDRIVIYYKDNVVYNHTIEEFYEYILKTNKIERKCPKNYR